MVPKVHAGMEVDMAGNGDSGRSGVKGKKMRYFPEKVKRFPGLVWRTMWKVGKEDPRRVIHALKVGLSLTLVSLLYLMEPLFEGIGQNAIWAVMTVVVVLEFTAGNKLVLLFLFSFHYDENMIKNTKPFHIHGLVDSRFLGATLCKGLNRGLGTLIAGSLAFFAEFIANATGRVFRAVFIGAAVFLIGKLINLISYHHLNVASVTWYLICVITHLTSICTILITAKRPHRNYSLLSIYFS